MKTMIKKIISTTLLGLGIIACVDHTIPNNPGGPGGTTGPGSNTGPTGPGSNTGGPGGNTGASTDVASSLTVTAIMSTSANTNTSCSSLNGVARLVCLTEAFKATLNPAQLTSVQLVYSKANVQKWSNLPASLSSRFGISLASLNTNQLAAFRNVMMALLALNRANEGYDELLGNLVADNFLAVNGGGTTYGAGNFYVSILGTPSNTGLWSILFTGHHYTQPYTFNGGQVTGVTPAFRAVEPGSPVSNTATGITYQPTEQERLAFAAMLAGLSSTELTAARLSSTFSDLVVGPGKDGQFPTTKVGIRVGDLSSAKQALVLDVIRLYVNDLEPQMAAAILARYTAELPNTYIAYAGNSSVSVQNDYVRIDGPSVWIELSYQGGIVIRNTPHPHSIWRDRTSDYGGN
jgi:hypothetical protein